MAYSAGELTERVTIRRVTETKNDYGTLVESPTDFGPYWCRVRPMTGRERDHAQQTESTANYLFVFRYGVHTEHTITERDTLVWRGVEHNIRFIKDRGPRAQFLEIEAERGVAT